MQSNGKVYAIRTRDPEMLDGKAKVVAMSIEMIFELESTEAVLGSHAFGCLCHIDLDSNISRLQYVVREPNGGGATMTNLVEDDVVAVENISQLNRVQASSSVIIKLFKGDVVLALINPKAGSVFAVCCSVGGVILCWRVRVFFLRGGKSMV